MDQATFSFSIKPLSSHTGAEIRGIDLSRPVDEATRAALNQAFVDHTVLAIRDQKLSAPEFLQAMQVFGEIFPQHNSRFQVPECPAIHYISNQDKLEDGKVYIPGEGYHTDHSNDREPPKATALHAVKLPNTGGDTQFVNMYEAYDALPEQTKKKIDGLQARHVYQSKHSERKLPKLSEERKAIASESVLHPLVRTHPRSGRKALYINPIRIEELIGMDDAEAIPLLDQLLEHATQIKFQYRHKWQAGDVVIWDNRCLMHKANGDYPVGEVRYLYRLMLKGGRPA
ncbi:MAG: Taurine dioxygenase [Xanthobacteraceae bacterium]|nr:Taurine dioxygenase [Xanthobacteraceae bacterium]